MHRHIIRSHFKHKRHFNALVWHETNIKRKTRFCSKKIVYAHNYTTIGYTIIDASCFRETVIRILKFNKEDAKRNVFVCTFILLQNKD